MDDCRAALLRAHADALLRLPRTRSLVAEATRLNAKVDAVLAARAAGESQWGSELPLFLQRVLELLQWEPAVCGAVRAVCSAWGDIHDEHCPKLIVLLLLAVMEGKLGWYPSVTEVDLTGCEDASGVLSELGSMPSLRSLMLSSSCAESAVDAEAVYGLTTLTTLILYAFDENHALVEAVGEWMLDLSRLTTLDSCAVTAQEVLALSNLSALTDLNLHGCENVAAEGLRAVIK
jgi:hypothetical protein